jgi:hypothetical protein
MRLTALVPAAANANDLDDCQVVARDVVVHHASSLLGDGLGDVVRLILGCRPVDLDGDLSGTALYVLVPVLLHFGSRLLLGGALKVLLETDWQNPKPQVEPYAHLKARYICTLWAT